MIGNDLIAEIPWIIFGALLAAVCVRLCRLRRFSGQQQDLEYRQSREGGGDSSVAPPSPGEHGADDHDGSPVSSSVHSASPAFPKLDPAAWRRGEPRAESPPKRSVKSLAGRG